MKTKIIVVCCLVLVVLIVAIVAWTEEQPPVSGQSDGRLIATAKFFCDGGKTINAAFYAGTSTPSADPNRPPVPGGSVVLVLSDGRNMTLPHVISADGGRYANADESIVFWNRGDTAFITENNSQTYANCAIPSAGNDATNNQ